LCMHKQPIIPRDRDQLSDGRGLFGPGLCRSCTVVVSNAKTPAGGGLRCGGLGFCPLRRLALYLEQLCVPRHPSTSTGAPCPATRTACARAGSAASPHWRRCLPLSSGSGARASLSPVPISHAPLRRGRFCARTSSLIIPGGLPNACRGPGPLGPGQSWFCLRKVDV
jgi:hypothetical protein